MSCLSSLTDVSGPLILDTSVLINLHACKFGERIVTSIPNDILVATQVAEELEHETSRRNGDHSFLHTLVANENVALVDLTDAEYQIFNDIVSGSPSLGDGEAATIAIASCRCLLPVIDERRGRTRVSAQTKGRTAAWSLDLFLHPTAMAALGDEVAVEALYLALRDGRMRIPAESADDVIEIIGEVRARDCHCLPNYRARFGNTQNSLTSAGPSRDH